MRKGLKSLAFERALKVIYHLNSCETQASINLSINSQALRVAVGNVKPPRLLLAMMNCAVHVLYLILPLLRHEILQVLS